MEFGEAIKAIKERLDIAEIARRYVDLRPQGAGRFVSPCPFHQETKPSFSVDAAKGFFYCFGCQESGDVISLYAKINGLDFKEAVSQLADEANISIDAHSRTGAKTKERTLKQLLLDMHELAKNHFKTNLARPESAACVAYLEKRGVSRQIIERFELGFASADWHHLEQCLARAGFTGSQGVQAGLLGQAQTGGFYDRFRDRLMFPIKSLSNQIIAFGGRIIADADEAKYINSADTPIYGKKEHLYGLAQARRGIAAKGQALLTEGYMDVLAMHQFGFDNCVGVLGTALTEEQIQRLSGFTSQIGLLFDGDRPGRKAALRAAEMLLCRGLSCSVILLPDGEDIDSLLHGQGSDAFKKLAEKAPDGLNFCLQTVKATLAPKDAIAWAKNFIAKLQVQELAGKYASIIAHKLGLSEQLFRNGLPKSQKSQYCLDHQNLCDRDIQIIAYAARYPERLQDLRDIGADLALTHQRSRDFWTLLERFGPDEVEYHLDQKQRKFWEERRNPPAPPRLNPELELSCLKMALERYYAQSQAASLQTALSGSLADNDFEADLQYLHAIRDAMRNNNEQS